MNKKPIIGILGGIASGKSTVAEQLKVMGCAVIDADGIAKDMLQNPDVRQQIRSAFGDAVFDAAGTVDKQKLAVAIFDSPSAVQTINSIIHPRVMAKTEQLLESYQLDPAVKAVVLDVPLLMEVGWEKRCDKLIFVACDEQKRLERAAQKRLLSEKLLKKRENFQISLDNKRKISHYILSNNENLSELKKQISEIFPALISKK